MEIDRQIDRQIDRERESSTMVRYRLSFKMSMGEILWRDGAP